METISDIIDAFGSAAEVSRILRIPDVTPRAWRRRNSIPTDYWPRLIDAGVRRGIPITAEVLLRACTHAPSFETPAPATRPSL